MKTRLRQARALVLVLGLVGVAGCTATPPERPPATGVADYYFLAFFEWDGADLSDRTRQIAAALARRAAEVNSPRIEIAGHADPSGPPDYNQRLSARRANNVAAELVRLGVDRRIIFISAFGETRPLVPTRDGVREPQNRRVELIAR